MLIQSVNDGGRIIRVRAIRAVNSNSYYRKDTWEVYFEFQDNRSLGKSNNLINQWNPLWLPYVREPEKPPYNVSDLIDPEDTLVILAFIQCAKASSPDL